MKMVATIDTEDLISVGVQKKLYLLVIVGTLIALGLTYFSISGAMLLLASSLSTVVIYFVIVATFVWFGNMLKILTVATLWVVRMIYLMVKKEQHAPFTLTSTLILVFLYNFNYLGTKAEILIFVFLLFVHFATSSALLYIDQHRPKLAVDFCQKIAGYIAPLEQDV